MTFYYINKNAQSTGEHEVHEYGCIYFPKNDNAFYLGDYTNCKDAVAKARIYYNNVDGCAYCCNPCHRR